MAVDADSAEDEIIPLAGVSRLMPQALRILSDTRGIGIVDLRLHQFIRLRLAAAVCQA